MMQDDEDDEDIDDKEDSKKVYKGASSKL